MAQWVKSLTTPWVTVEVWVRSPHSGLKDPVLLQLRLEFKTDLGNFHVLQVRPLKNKKKKTKHHHQEYLCTKKRTSEDIACKPSQRERLQEKPDLPTSWS